MVSQHKGEAPRKQQQRRLRVQQMQRLDLAYILPHNGQKVILDELVSANSSTDDQRAITLEHDTIRHVSRVKVGLAGSQQDGGLRLVKPQAYVSLSRESSAGDGENLTQVQRSLA